MDSLISIVVPIYNVEKYLDRCVQSIVGQTYNNLEIILVDDGSPDNCPEICEVWAKKDKRITVYHKPNGGLSDARNYGIDRANGDYIGFVDSDDYISPDMIGTMVYAIQKNDCRLACCGRIYKNGESETRSRSLEFIRVMDDKTAIHELLTNGCVEEAAWDKLYERSLWDNLRFPKGEINEDIVVMPEIIRRARRVVHVGEPFYYYCYNNTSITKSGYNEKKDVMFRHLVDLEEYIKQYYPDELESVKVIESRYALTTLFSIIQANEEKEFEQAYKGYKAILRKSYKQMLVSKNMSKKQKLEASLLVCGLYKVVWNILHKN